MSAFNPLGFLTLAKQLSNSKNQDEGELRTAVSRAYYALFNVVIEKLRVKGIRFSGTAVDHDKVVRYLKNSQVDAVDSIGSDIEGLRSSRNDADYDLDSKDFKDRKNVQFLVLQASTAIQEFGKCKIVDVISGINNYKKKINEI